jgi:hypothetical protein
MNQKEFSKILDVFAHLVETVGEEALEAYWAVITRRIEQGELVKEAVPALLWYGVRQELTALIHVHGYQETLVLLEEIVKMVSQETGNTFKTPATCLN